MADKDLEDEERGTLARGGAMRATYFEVVIASIFLFLCFRACSATLVPHQTMCKTTLFPSHQVNISGCLHKEVSMNQCVGLCHSVDQYPKGKGNSICTCCQPVKFRQKEEEFLCIDKDGAFKTAIVSLREPTVCACKTCRELRG